MKIFLMIVLLFSITIGVYGCATMGKSSTSHTDHQGMGDMGSGGY
jgi:hypothetical protein